MANPEKKESDILAEADEIHRLNEAMAYANYMGSVSVLRADLLLKMESVGISPEKLGWMYFVVSGDEAGGLATPFADILILCTLEEEESKDGKLHKRPKIRMFKSERFDTPLGLEYLTSDVTVDHEGDSQFLMDTIFVSSGDDTHIDPQTDATVKSMEAIRDVTAYVPFFRVNSDGELMMGGNLFSFTSPFTISQIEEDGREYETRPFGHYKVLTDASYALDIAISLFDEVRNIPPTHIGEAKSTD